ncbi:MAG: hypothetical protein A2451_14015, partial [Bdellovibrionales bacterium RIFOXYC2_FULL_39_8]
NHKKLCVCELAELLDITQPSVSKHLKKLKEAGLISSEQDGFWTNYYLSKELFKNHKFIKLILDEVQELKDVQQRTKQIQSLERKKLCCKKQS